MSNKRQGTESSQTHTKKRKFTNAAKLLSPFTSGVYATCARRKENQARRELMSVLAEKVPEYFDLSKTEEEDKDQDQDQDEVDKAVKEGNKKEPELSIEEKIQQELSDLKDQSKKDNDHLQPMELDCECVLFIKTRKPIDPETLVQNFVKDCFESGIKSTRYTQKLIPITDSCSTGDEPQQHLRDLAKRVLKRHFHQEEGQKPVKFAIQVGKKNFNTLKSDEIIRIVAECVGRDHGHQVDLKNYDKLIMVECYKNNIGMGVVKDFQKYCKFNLQLIFDKLQEKN